jgi:hypothetical protein
MKNRTPLKKNLHPFVEDFLNSLVTTEGHCTGKYALNQSCAAEHSLSATGLNGEKRREEQKI